MKILLALSLALLLPVAGQAQIRYLAFGDSITEGFGDDPEREEKGYPPRLEILLAERGITAEVENHGVGGETTGEGLTRIEAVLAGGGDVLLLMEGTNDVGQKVSVETLQFNLAEIARKAADLGIETVHATIVPRLPTANTDGDNRVTGQVAVAARDLAWTQGRKLADPFQVFLATPDPFETLYVGGTDKLHPNAAGYDLLARIFADVLTDRDTVPPVPGEISPADGEEGVPADVQILVDLYDFGTGIDLAETALLVNGDPVSANFNGDARRIKLRYQPMEPLKGAVSVGIRSQDLADPPNRTERTLTRFVVEGTVFLDGDLDRSGRVDGADLVVFALGFGARKGEKRYLAATDFNGDGVIDGLDLAILAANFGQSSFG